MSSPPPASMSARARISRRNSGRALRPFVNGFMPSPGIFISIPAVGDGRTRRSSPITFSFSRNSKECASWFFATTAVARNLGLAADRTGSGPARFQHSRLRSRCSRRSDHRFQSRIPIGNFNGRSEFCPMYSLPAASRYVAITECQPPSRPFCTFLQGMLKLPSDPVLPCPIAGPET